MFSNKDTFFCPDGIHIREVQLYALECLHPHTVTTIYYTVYTMVHTVVYTSTVVPLLRDHLQIQRNLVSEKRWFSKGGFIVCTVSVSMQGNSGL